MSEKRCTDDKLSVDLIVVSDQAGDEYFHGTPFVVSSLVELFKISWNYVCLGKLV